MCTGKTHTGVCADRALCARVRAAYHQQNVSMISPQCDGMGRQTHGGPPLCLSEVKRMESPRPGERPQEKRERRQSFCLRGRNMRGEAGSGQELDLSLPCVQNCDEYVSVCGLCHNSVGSDSGSVCGIGERGGCWET